MPPDFWNLYREMLRSRLFEEAVLALWEEGLISGEMHLALGEEAIAAGTVAHLRDGDAIALDHRGTPQLLMRSVDPVGLLREFLGRPDGLCGGLGGHMHLFSPETLTASSGIVGSSGPAGVGFALAGKRLRPGSVALAYFGEGAMNQGMLLESLNLAVAWQLPLLFVCKDDSWSITTPSAEVRGGELLGRAEGFGLPATSVDGGDVGAVFEAAGQAIERARQGEGPFFLHARCRHFEGHMAGVQILRLARQPLGERQLFGPVLRSVARRKGGPLRKRVESLGQLFRIIWNTRSDTDSPEDDPLARARPALAGEGARLAELEEEVAREVQGIVRQALA